MEKESCSTCKFFRVESVASQTPGTILKIEDVDQGFCHRLPPHVRLSNDEDGPPPIREHIGVWLDDWCGEWEGKG